MFLLFPTNVLTIRVLLQIKKFSYVYISVFSYFNTNFNLKDFDPFLGVPIVRNFNANMYCKYEIKFDSPSTVYGQE